jgi:anti-anti-sigma factor
MPSANRNTTVLASMPGCPYGERHIATTLAGGAVAASTFSIRLFTHTIVIVVRGAVDAENAAGLRQMLVDAIVRRRPRRLIIDLARATTLDPLAIGALLAAQDTASDVHVTVALRHPRGSVADQLARAGLTA